VPRGDRRFEGGAAVLHPARSVQAAVGEGQGAQALEISFP
jgi:hypothetical protein